MVRFLDLEFRALEAFIRAKYEHKKYIAREWVPPKPVIPKEVRKLSCLSYLAIAKLLKLMIIVFPLSYILIAFLLSVLFLKYCGVP